jgi:hypothetical protein
LLSVNAQAKEPAKEKWVDINVVVNLVDANDADNVDTIVNEANATLQQARIRLIVKKVNKNVKIGDGDAKLTDDESLDAVVLGEKELKKVLGAGKGIKITIADDVRVETPDTVGWNIHRNPVVFIETSLPPTQMGQVLAHEIGHFLTLEHVDDSNNMMFPSTPSGQNLVPNQSDEIFQEAKKKGTPYFRKPQPLPEESIERYEGVEWILDGFGAILDKSGDVRVDDGSGTATESNDPSFAYADLQQVTAFCDEPLTRSGTIECEIEFGGQRPTHFSESTTFVSFTIDRDDADGHFSSPDGILEINMSGEGPATALLRDPFLGSVVDLPPPNVLLNEEFDVSSAVNIINYLFQAQVPTELLGQDLCGSESITIRCESRAADHRNGPVSPLILTDSTEPFTFDLTGRPPGPAISFIPGGAGGHGFTGSVQLSVDKNVAAIVQANADGRFFYTGFSGQEPSLPPLGTQAIASSIQLAPGVHSVIAKELDDSGPQGAAHAIGFFIFCPQGQPVGDFDNDCDEDFDDFAIFANDWLRGK